MVTVGQQQRGKHTHSASDPLDADPPQREHGGVMKDVQKRDLIVLLAKNEDDRVQQLHQLRDVEPPDGGRDLTDNRCQRTTRCRPLLTRATLR